MSPAANPLKSELERIERELSAIYAWMDREPDQHAAYLWVIGINDWEMERELALKQSM